MTLVEAVNLFNSIHNNEITEIEIEYGPISNKDETNDYEKLAGQRITKFSEGKAKIYFQEYIRRNNFVYVSIDDFDREINVINNNIDRNRVDGDGSAGFGGELSRFAGHAFAPSSPAPSFPSPVI